jgi:hypothetical protein
MGSRMSLILVGSLLLAATFSGPAGAGAPGVGFHAPVTLPGSDGGDEPSLAISQGGVRYASWQSPGEFASSPDGVSFVNLGSPDENAVGDVTNAVDAAGALYNGQICGDPQNILHTCIYRSLDGGVTWPQRTDLADNHPGASDRPWIDVYPHQSDAPWNPDQTTVFLEYHTFSPEELAYVTMSTDGGKSFGPPQMITTDTNAIVGSGCNTVPGGVVVDDATGTAYALWLSGNDVESNIQTGCNYSQIGPFNKAWVSASVDGGTTWTSHLVWQGSYDPATKIGDNANKIFGTIAVDGAGQIHAVVAARRQDDPTTFAATGAESSQPTDLLLASSPDRGAHWTQPVKVSQTQGSYFFPWLAAGSAGQLDADYYRSTTLRPNSASSVWYLGFSQITNATATMSNGVATYVGAPRVRELLPDRHPAHLGGICTFGIFCTAVGGNRSLADSISIAIDPSGAANLAWTSDYPNGSASRRVLFACQNAGPGILGGKAVNHCYQATP